MKALDQSGIDVRSAPLFLVIGKPAGSEEALFDASGQRLMVRRAPASVTAPLHVYAGPDAIFVTCAGASLLGNLADILANAADPNLRDPVQAVALAEKATELDPKGGVAWGTLGQAYYRNGQWQEAITALDKGLAFLKSDNSEFFFFLAMAHHRAGHKDQAQKWYDKGIAWMDKHAPKDSTLLRYRSEAARVLGVK